jgi:DNA-binding SARP family transcriptional activator
VAVAAPPAASVQDLPVYTVQPPHHGRHDTLWGIATRHLGDGARYREILTLNVGRIQVDGHSLRDPDLIRPGWTLLLPADARGVSTLTAPPSARTAPNLVKEAPEPSAPSVPVAVPRPAEAPDHASDHRDAEHHDGGHDTAVISALLSAGFGLSALAAVAVLDRRHRLASRHRPVGTRLQPPPPALRDTERQLRRAARTAGPAAAALRNAVQYAAVQGSGPITAVRRSADKLDLIGPDPAAAIPPFTGTEDGWRIATADLASLADCDAPDPAPALALLGTAIDVEHYRNLEAAGWVEVNGDSDEIDRWLAALIGDLAGAPWASALNVLTPQRLTLPGVTDPIPDGGLSDRPVPAPTGAGALTTARAAAGCEDVTTVVLLGFASRDLPARWRDAAADPSCPVVAITCGDPTQDSEGAGHHVRWQLHGGNLELGDGTVLTVRDLTDRDRSAANPWRTMPDTSGNTSVGRHPLRDVIEHSSAPQYGPAADDTESPTIPVLAPDPSGAGVQELPGEAERPEGPIIAATNDVLFETEAVEPALPDATAGRAGAAVGRDHTTESPSGPGIQIRMLGPVEIHGGTRPRRTQVLLMLLYLALHRRPVSSNELRDKLWPDRTPSTDEVRQRVREARDAIAGHITGGQTRALTPEVSTDWDTFRTLAKGGTSDQLAALSLVRGRPLEDIRDDACAEWLDEGLYRSEMEAAVVDLALQVADACTAASRHHDAYTAARAGLRACPWDERLYRSGIDAARAMGAHGSARALISELRAVLDVDIEPEEGIEPETVAVIERRAAG